MRSNHVHNEAELDALAERDTLQGLIVNEVESIGSKERKILSESYPGIDFSTCWILEEGRKPKSRGTAAGIMGAGGLGVLVGLAGLIVRGRNG